MNGINGCSGCEMVWECGQEKRKGVGWVGTKVTSDGQGQNGRLVVDLRVWEGGG